ncbi:HD family phosphohydrolase [Paenibacillus sp. SYP-B3998]|uniref:HD family phosphohydrolase n=2 Tax=Paenibacillus sp. SYP-B3998 TaxID=2678564 RepID=A0A6G4A2U7_9BACL|nr:HD family phosphohydrolase [Paenibacillus sp. SYP-B3998]
MYGLWFIGFIVLLLLGWFVYDKRYQSKETAHSNKPSHGFVWTAEVFIDPKDGLTYRVYYNPRSGDRAYIRENE